MPPVTAVAAPVKVQVKHDYPGFGTHRDPISAFGHKPVLGVINFGIELEIGVMDCQGASRMVWDRVGTDAVSKRDATVQGIEIASRPLLFSEVDSYFDRLLGEEFPNSHTSINYGMHVHVSNDTISDETTNRILDLLQEPRYQTFWTWAFGRDTKGGSYNTLVRNPHWEERALSPYSMVIPRWAGPGILVWLRGQEGTRAPSYLFNSYDIRFYKTENAVTNRWTIKPVNTAEELASYYPKRKTLAEVPIRDLVSAKTSSGFVPYKHSDTHEFRQFRTTFDKETAKANVQLCDALIRYCEMPRREDNLSSFVAFVKRHTRRYAQLRHRLLSEKPRMPKAKLTTLQVAS